MKLILSPLRVFAGCLIVYSLYFIISGEGGNLVGLGVIAIWFLALLCLGLSYLLRRLCRNASTRFFIIEFLILAAGLFFFYQRNGYTLLRVPKNFNGYIHVVYGVKGAAALERPHFFSANAEVSVPASGIIMTSSSRSGGIGIYDSASGKVTAGKNGPGFPFQWDVVRCDKETYQADLVAFKNYERGWSFKTDTIRLKQHREATCVSISHLSK